MPDDVVTLALDGELSVEEFAKAAQAFSGLLKSLTQAVAPSADLEWMVERLDTSSAIMSARADSEDVQQVERVTSAYLVVGRSLSAREPIPYPPDVVRYSRDITNLIDRRVPHVRFETARETFLVDARYGSVVSVSHEKVLTARGAVRGTIQTLSNRKGLRFTLYDSVFDKAVSCYLREGQDNMMRHVWGKLAYVEGTVTRDPETGRPLAIRRITDVQLVREREPGSYRRARGIAPTSANDDAPENVIRRLRDAE
jgi:hypothetical protein